ncbi:MAG: hypothetical protein WKF79_06460 [Nocardioides sp.]
MPVTSYATTALAAVMLALGSTACGVDAGRETASPTTTPETTSETSPSSWENPSESPSESLGVGAVEAFTAYAEGGRPEVPWADVVTYSITGERVARFASGAADRRGTWEGCPARTTTYEGRDCPVSPLGTIAMLAREGGQVVYESAPPRIVGCNRYRAPLDDATTTIWIRPDEQHRDCFSDFALTLSLDRSGRVAAVDLALSGP